MGRQTRTYSVVWRTSGGASHVHPCLHYDEEVKLHRPAVAWSWGHWERFYVLPPIYACCIDDPVQRIKWWDRFELRHAPKLAKLKGLIVGALINDLVSVIPYPSQLDVLANHFMEVRFRRPGGMRLEEYAAFLSDAIREATEQLEGPGRREQEKKAAAHKALRLDPNGPLRKEHYDLFDLPPIFSLDDLKKAYRRAARQYHPDTGGSHEDMKIVNRLRERFERLAVS